MNIPSYILFDTERQRENLLPLTFTRPAALMRTGIFTIAEKWEFELSATVSHLTAPYLSEKFLTSLEDHNVYINGAVCPDSDLLLAIKNLSEGYSLKSGSTLLAFVKAGRQINFENIEAIAAGLKVINYEKPVTLIARPWDVFMHNGAEIKRDFKRIASLRKSVGISDKNTIVYGVENVFVEKGAMIRAAVINAENGPVYIGKNTEVQEGSLIRGPFALCENSTVNMGGKMRGDTTIGPHCKVGGEISNSVIFGFSNKAHDGFLGNSVLGEWCNLGADTNNSNLKNNYASVDVWSYAEKKNVDTGLQFCGLIMGDHSKSGINTMFNTGTLVGVSTNIFQGDFPPKFIPSFSWGGAQWLRTYVFDKAIETAERVMQRRGVSLNDTERKMLKHIYELEAPFRKK